jgi:hypothetical protein
VCVRAAPPNQSSQNPQVMERGGGPSYTPDRLPHPLAMSEGTGCTRGMATAPLNGDHTICAYVTPDIPPPLPRGMATVHIAVERCCSLPSLAHSQKGGECHSEKLEAPFHYAVRSNTHLLRPLVDFSGLEKSFEIRVPSLHRRLRPPRACTWHSSVVSTHTPPSPLSPPSVPSLCPF